MLAGAPQLKIMTTSRIALQLHGEREYPVPPLNLPKPGDISVEDLAGNESVSLFVERAQGSNPNFTLSRENAPAVAEICRSLDGLPLAIELAAARIRVLSPAALSKRLDSRLHVLLGGGADRPPRHQTMSDTIAWGYELLEPHEQRLFRELSVCCGEFSLEAAERVTTGGAGTSTLDGLTALVENSL